MEFVYDTRVNILLMQKIVQGFFIYQTCQNLTAAETEVVAQASENANAIVTGCSFAKLFSSPGGQGRTVAALVLTYMYRARSNIASCIHQAL